MSILVRFTPASSMTAEQYDEVIRRLESEGDFPPDGLEYHFAFIDGGSVRVGEVWASQEQFEAFGQRLMPILADVGIDPGKPKIDNVHNTVKR